MYYAHHVVSTPENVDLRFELAGLGNRVLAAFLDTLFSYILVGLLWGLSAAVLYVLDHYLKIDLPDFIMFVLAALGIFASFLILFGYFIFFEGLWQGQTPGKKIAGIRVVRENGEPVSWMPVFLRNLLRMVDEGIFLIGLIFIVVEKSERRLGDLAAGTIVIRERPSARSIVFRSPTDAQTGDNANNTTAPTIDDFADITNVKQLEQADYELVNNFLWRRQFMLKASRTEMAKKLAKYIALKLSPSAPYNETTSAEAYLEKL